MIHILVIESQILTPLVSRLLTNTLCSIYFEGRYNIFSRKTNLLEFYGSLSGSSVARSEAGESNYSTKISEKRLQKLLRLKEREEMKDLMIARIKDKYYEEHPEVQSFF